MIDILCDGPECRAVVRAGKNKRCPGLTEYRSVAWLPIKVISMVYSGADDDGGVGKGVFVTLAASGATRSSSSTILTT
jgi:hypothetical protein